jgi:hypothetical protein
MLIALLLVPFPLELEEPALDGMQGLVKIPVETLASSDLARQFLPPFLIRAP